MKVGGVAYGQPNSTIEVPASIDALGGFLNSPLGAKYAALAKAGRIFYASNVAAQAVTVALATTYTGLVIYNPFGNTKRAIMLFAKYALSVAPAAIASLHLLNMSSQSAAAYTHTTPLAAPGIQSSQISPTAPRSTMGADSAATIPTPNYLMPTGSGFTAAALYADPTSLWLPLEGSITIEPGGAIAWGALTAVTGFGGFAWYEENLSGPA